MTAQRQERNGWRRRTAAIALLAASAAAPVCAATTERVVTDRYTGLAIDGFDPVAYFSDHRPIKGSAGVEVPISGAVWRFANPDNRAFFVAHPDVYGPQFGGYDAVDVARGVVVAGSSQFWTIAGQRLYLFAREQSRDAFAADPVRYLAEAHRRWPGLQESLAQ